jgi:VanZ family protein
MRKTFIVYHLPVLIYAALIFWGSSLHSIPHKFPFELKDKFLHAGEYFVLGALLTRSLSVIMSGLTGRAFIIWIGFVGALYAASDELHQYFVPGRSCDFADWIADIVGLACGAAIIYIIGVRKRTTGQIG